MPTTSTESYGKRPLPRFYTVADVAGSLAISPRTVRRWITKKELAAHRFGSAVRIAEQDLRDFLANRTLPRRYGNDRKQRRF